MEIKILEQRPNPLLKRTEFRFEVAHATVATPSRDEVRGELAKAVHGPKDRLVIEWMTAKYGSAKTLGEGALYESVDAAKLVAREHILIRNGLKEKAVKTPAVAEETPAPAPPAAEKKTAEPAKGTPAAATPKDA